MFKIKVYLHETVDSDILYGLLKKEKFDVISSIRIGMINKKDNEHLGSAFVESAILLTKIDIISKIRHKGILVSKNMMPAQIVKALKNLRKQVDENEISLENTVYPLSIFL